LIAVFVVGVPGDDVLVGLGALSFRQSSEEWSLQEAIDRVNQDSGVAILGHPYWLGQRAEDMRELHGFVGMEVYNSVCQRDRAKGFSSVHWDDYCNACGLTWGFATDGGHLSLAGVQVLGSGPGREAAAHTADESVTLEELRNCFESYMSLLLAFDQVLAGT